MKNSRFLLKYREFISVLGNEYRNIFGDAGVVLVVIGAILIYATIYSLAYKNEVLRDIPIAIVDHSRTAASRELTRAFDATPNLDVKYKAPSLDEAKKLFFERKINGIIVIPNDYERKVMRGEKVNLAIYADASYFLMYRQVFFDITNSMLTSGSNIEWVRLVSKGASAKQAEAVSNPVTITVKNMYNPYGGYASFVMPAILIVIIQQTLLIGIGMVGGTWREKGIYKKLIPQGEKRLAVMPIVLGKSTAYISIYAITMAYIFGFHYKIFGYPMNGALSDIILFLTPYVLSCTFLGIALSSLFRYRENSLLILLFTSIPFLMLSGASIPKESMPSWLYALGRIIPSSSGVDGFVRIQTMGATLNEVSMQLKTLWILSGAYFILACMGMRFAIRRADKELLKPNYNK